MTISTDSPDQSNAPDLAIDPYGFFEYMRKTEPVWRGTLMDTGMAPPGMSSEQEWTLFAIGVEALLWQFFELDPEWRLDVKSGTYVVRDLLA